MEECSFTSNVTDNKKRMCELACRSSADDKVCKRLSELQDEAPNNGSMMPGSPCDNFRVSRLVLNLSK